MSNKEKWCVIEEYPVYAVSNLGNVKRVVADSLGRLRKPYLKGTVTSRGYVQLALWRNGVAYVAMLHRVVCRAFHGPATTQFHIVAHNDGNSLNNVAVNLRWATALENEQDKRIHGTVACGERQGSAKLTEYDVIAIRTDKRSQRAIAASYGITQANVSIIVRNESWRHIP